MTKSGPKARQSRKRAGGTRTEALFAAQNEIIDLMAAGAGLTETLSAIARMVERLAPHSLCSVLLLQPDGKHLRQGAAPSLPEEYSRAIDGLEIGPSVGSCGTAAFRKVPVIVRDIATDPLWDGPREFTLSFGLRACWSKPIIGKAGAVLGTIAMYHRVPRAPTARDFGLLEPGARLVRLALAQHRQQEQLLASEARSRLAAEAADLGTYDIDLVSGEIVWSNRLKEILGFPEDFVPTHEALAALIHPEERRRFEAVFREWKSGNQKPRDTEYRIARADTGAERLITLPGRILFNAQGSPVRAVGVTADVTEQRAAEQTQRDTQRHIHEIQKMEALGQLAGGIAHDLNNTLMPILGLSKLAMQEIGPLDPLAEPLQLIHRSGERARDLVNQILLFSRNEEITRGPVELAPLVRDSLTLSRASIAADIRFEVALAQDAVVWANRGQIDQVLTNLVANAAQAIGGNGGTIRIELARDTLPKTGAKMARISVTDDGPGIDPAALNRLFEPFFTTKRIGEGTGLGLAVAHGIVANHHGRIEVSSRIGEGARFDVYLPLFEAALAPVPALEHA